MVCRRSVDSIIEQPSTTQLDHIRKELDGDTERAKHAENLLYTWIDYQQHFPKKYERKVIRNFLRNCKHNVERVKWKLENHFVTKTLHPNIYSERSPFSKEMEKTMKTLNIFPIPKLTEKGYRIFFFKLENFDPANFSMLLAIKLYLMLYDLLLTSEHPVGGEIAIFDCQGTTPNHFIKIVSPALKIATKLLRESYAVRLKQIHILNAPPMMDKILGGIKPLLHKRIQESFIVHTNEKSICDHFGKDLLPSNYGGNLKSARELAEDWYDAIKENADWYLEQESVKITDFIPKKGENGDYFKEQLGIEGSFRKLEID